MGNNHKPKTFNSNIIVRVTRTQQEQFKQIVRLNNTTMAHVIKSAVDNYISIHTQKQFPNESRKHNRRKTDNNNYLQLNLDIEEQVI